MKNIKMTESVNQENIKKFNKEFGIPPYKKEHQKKIAKQIFTTKEEKGNEEEKEKEEEKKD